MKKLLFVYNPKSGKGTLGKFISEILCIFADGGYDLTVHPTCAHKDGENYIKKHAREHDLVVCAGGDGMLHELVCAMTEVGKDIPCGYIPAGTVNDFAISLGIPKHPIKAAKMIVEGNFEPVDVGVFNDTNFSYIAAFGIFTRVSYSTDQKAKNALGYLAYLFEAAKEMNIKAFRNSSFKATISWDGGSVTDDFIFGMAGNTLSMAGMKKIAPDAAAMNDGLLDGFFIKTPKTLLDLDRIRQGLLNKKIDSQSIVALKFDKIQIDSDREVSWTLDGEFGGSYKSSVISVNKGFLKVATAKGAEKLLSSPKE